MKFLLLNPPFVPRFNRTGCRWASKTRSDTVCYPLWLAYATGWLEKKGHTCRLVDAPASCLDFGRVSEVVDEFNPDYIVVDTATSSVINDTKVARKLKQLYDGKMVMVGTHASAYPHETLRLSRADYVIMGEYDVVLGQLGRGKPFRSKVLTGLPMILLDELPFASKIYKTHLDINDYFYSLCRYPEVQIMSSRGCHYHCNYCTWAHVFTGRHVRYRSVENLVDEMEYITMELPQVKDIVIEDDTFTHDHERVLEVCREIKKRNLDIDWIVNARADVPYNILKEMKSAGCRLLIVGYESGNQTILNRARKGLKLETMLKFSRDAKNAGLQIMGCFMIGLLGETRKTAWDTFEFAKKVDPDFYFFSPATPFAGTEFYQICKREGYLVSEDWKDWVDIHGYLRNVVDYPQLSHQMINELIDMFLWRFALRKRFVLKSLQKIIRHPILEGKRFLRSLMHGIQYYLDRR